MSALFDNERRRSECVIWANVPNTSSRIVEYFLKRTLCLICRIPFDKVSIELIAIYFHSLEVFRSAEKVKKRITFRGD
jgi:hypothetical protein